LCTQQRCSRVVGDGELRSNRETAASEIEQQLAPGFRALAQTVGKADELLLALGGCADDDEDALRLVLEPSFQVNAIGPEVDVPFGREVALAPLHMFLGPRLFER
jgi:hypothetical protein